MHDLNGNRIAEVAHDPATGASTLLREYLWADDLAVAVREGGQTYYLHIDHIGRPVLATNQAGAVVGRASYTPFGGIQSVSVTPGALSAQELRFPGQWFQAETGLHQNWMRDYDSTTGRYLQADPLGLIDGPSVYGYARQSPLRYTDPRGEQVDTRLPGAIPYIFCMAAGLSCDPTDLFRPNQSRVCQNDSQENCWILYQSILKECKSMRKIDDRLRCERAAFDTYLACLKP